MVAGLERKAEVANQKCQQAIDARAARFEAFELKIKEHEKLMAAWDFSQAEFKAAQDEKTAAIGEFKAELAGIAEDIRRIKRIAAETQAGDDDDDIDVGGDDDDDEMGTHADASDEELTDAAEGEMSSAAGQAAEEGEIAAALPDRTTAEWRPIEPRHTWTRRGRAHSWTEFRFLLAMGCNAQ
jgi:hypothetical protein